MLYKILVEAKLSKELEVESNSYEEAVALVAAQKIQLTGKANVTWIGTKEKVDLLGTYEYENLGICEWCSKTILDNPVEGQPWNFDSDPNDNHHGFVCYACIKADEAKRDVNANTAPNS